MKQELSFKIVEKKMIGSHQAKCVVPENIHASPMDGCLV